MAKNRVFFPQDALDTWLVEDRVELSNDELLLKSEGRRFRISEAARVLREVTGQPDSNEIVGKVKSKNFLTELGAEIVENSMIIGDNAYDIVQGWMGLPIGAFADHVKAHTAAPAVAPEGKRSPSSDEELLGQFLMRVL